MAQKPRFKPPSPRWNAHSSRGPDEPFSTQPFGRLDTDYCYAPPPQRLFSMD